MKCEQAEMIQRHDKDAAQQEKIQAEPLLPESLDVVFTPQGNRLPDATPPVMEIGHLENDFQRFCLVAEVDGLGEIPGNRGKGRFACFARGAHFFAV